MREKTLKSEKTGLGVCLVKGVGIGLSVALIGILLFAFILRFTNMSEKLITPVNQVIKGISIFFGVFLGLKGRKTNGLFGGLLIGFFFTLFAFLVFSLLSGAFSFDGTLFGDLIFGSIIGTICGIICVNLKKS